MDGLALAQIKSKMKLRSILWGLGAIFALGLFFFARSFVNQSVPSVLKISFSSFQSVKASKVDPSRVDTVTQANFIRNLYSRLVEYNPDGSLVPSAASAFTWKGDSVFFQFRPNFRTVDGYAITAEDAAFSLKRLLIKGNNTHGDLENFLCPGSKISSMSDPCPGIRVEGDQLVLTVADPTKKTFLVPLLASTDFSVVPTLAFDRNDPELPLIDYRNTSGAYYLSVDSPTGAHELRANPLHHLHNDRTPKIIQMVPAYGDKAEELFRAGQIDMITTASFLHKDKLEKLAQDFPDISTHQTQNIALRAVTYTKRGLKELNPEQRLYIGREVRARFRKALSLEYLDSTQEFFPVFGEGSLQESENKLLAEKFNSLKKPAFSGKVEMAVPPGEKAKYQAGFNIPELEFVESVQAPWTLPENKQPHFYISFVDSAFFEDISLISYNIDMGTFGLDRRTGAAWLSDYMATEKKEDRLVKLRKLHLDFLLSGNIVPIGNGPYTAAVKPPWKIGFSKFYAGTPLWLIQAN